MVMTTPLTVNSQTLLVFASLPSILMKPQTHRPVCTLSLLNEIVKTLEDPHWKAIRIAPQTVMALRTINPVYPVPRRKKLVLVLVLAKYGEWESVIGGIIDWIEPEASTPPIMSENWAMLVRAAGHLA